MEPAQYTEGLSPSYQNDTRLTSRNSQQQQSRPRPKSQPSKQRRGPARLHGSDPKRISVSDGSDRERETGDVEEVARKPRPSTSGSVQSGSRPARRRPAAPRPVSAPSTAIPSEDEHLVDPVPLRPGISNRRAAPKRTPRLGENSASALASDTDTTSSSSSSSSAFQPFRRPPAARRPRTDMGLSLRAPIGDMPEDGGELPPGGPDFSTPRPEREKNPRDILNEGERGFIVDLRLNLDVEVHIKAKLTGDLTLSVL
ncbi:hypothetical protein CORC01_05784 [Colletotrichum orchidophilum]|uniref:Uncharacterized protein n=1 Tax=Colletotrichum orchidophilum TaxID=1209926 RepID=A0A1G4BBX0_9PEZI|nr:uncharacterized protein CORC01_05784 [Colletotrichum orchidophilum]OHE98888.1 hypothetical protein CORC01_05784 [Colletotrichum orchidophilum]